jgi:hypothetical protein
MNALKTAAFAITFGFFAFASEAPRAADNPFGRFTGSWSGSGTITAQSGTRERIRCRGRYTANETGNTLNLGLRCASDSYTFELQSDINYDGGNISGSWNEVTRQVFGSLFGRSSSSRIEATAHSVGFTATLSITTRGNNQSVSIKSPGSEISEVAISLAKAGR